MGIISSHQKTKILDGESTRLLQRGRVKKEKREKRGEKELSKKWGIVKAIH
jgi:hypothetical protein